MPPPGVEATPVVKPTHTLNVPVIVVGFELTVTTVVLIQPVPSAYVMVDVPNVLPVTTPVDGSMLALPLLLVHVPPAGVELSVVVRPTHITGVPVIVVGFGLTVTIAVLIQPVPSV